MLTIIKNDWSRIMEEKKSLIFSQVLIILSVLMAVFLTGKMQPKINVAVVKGEVAQAEENSELEGGSLHASDRYVETLNFQGDSNFIDCLKSQSGIQIIQLIKAPSVVDLIEKKYDAVLIYQEDGNYEIQAVRDQAYIQQLDAMLHGQGAETETNGRKMGTNIIGYMFMFLLMEGVSLGRYFCEDKEKHQIERIVSSPIPFTKYIAGHEIFMSLMMFIPSFLVIMVVDLCGVEIGFALWQYVILLGLLCLLSIGFSIFVNSLTKVTDTANMIGCAFVVLTSILSGSFYDMTDGNSIFGKILYCLPQKGFMQFMTAWEKHNLNGVNYLELSYVIIITAVLMAFGVIKTRKDYIYRG